MRPTDVDMLPELARVIAAFFFVIATMYGIAWAVRRLGLDKKWQGTGRAQGELALEDSLFIDAKRRLVVARYKDARYLLLLGPNGDTLLTTSPAPATES